MTNLTEKLDEVQAQLASQHTAMLSAIQAIRDNSLIANNLLQNISTQSELLNAINNKLFVGDGFTDVSLAEYARLSWIETQGVKAALFGGYNDVGPFSIGSNMARAVFGIENIATSNNGNNSILQALDTGQQQANRILSRLADCSCNGGEEVPTSTECSGDYRKVTITRKRVEDGVDSWLTIRKNGTTGPGLSYPSWVSDIRNVNQVPGVDFGPNDFDSNQSALILCDKIGESYCIENIGARPFFIAYVVENSAIQDWQTDQVNPGESYGVNMAEAGARTIFAIVSPTSAANEDAFRCLVFYQPPSVV